MIKRREESGTYLTHVCRHHSSGDSLEKRLNMGRLVNTVAFMSCRHKKLHLQLIKATVLAESSLYFIFSPGYLHYCDAYRQGSGRCCSLSFFLTFLSPLQLSNYWKTKIFQHKNDFIISIHLKICPWPI